MKAMASTLVLCVYLAGCSILHPDAAMLARIETENARVEQMVQPVPASDACPPLPEIPTQSDRSAGRLFTLTVIALYEQCAKSKK